MPRLTMNDAFFVEMRRASVDEVIERLMSINLLKTGMTCSACSSEMSLVKDRDMADAKAWRCPKGSCSGKRKKKSIRSGSFFENYKLSLSEVFCAIYYWSVEKSISDVISDLGISLPTAVRIYSQVRERVANYIDSAPAQLGGPGIVCQIDESCFSHKIKAHRGRAPENPVWAFGIIDSSLPRGGFHIEIVPNRSADTLLPIIQRHVLPGTTIHSDEWAAYARIHSRLNLEHATVNHSLHFV